MTSPSCTAAYNIHNWIMEDYEDAVFAAAYRALKSGGTFGVEEHRGTPGMTRQRIKDNGYVPEDVVLGVWTLPPTYALKDKDRDKYAAIGESDRMTLKFVKQ